mgnify:FL=1|jgi:hypothetical protein
MEDNTTFFGALLEKAESYGKTTIDLIKLKAVDQLSKIASNAVYITIIAIFTFFFLMVLNMALAFWIGDLLGKIYIGFFVVSAFYVLLIILLIIFKKQIIKTPLSNKIISKFLK